MLNLIYCEFAKLQRKPLTFVAAFLSILMPLVYMLLLSNAQTSEQAVEGIMSCLFQLSAYLLLMPIEVVLASNLFFEEQDNGTLKNLLTVPVSKPRLAIGKMLVILIFSIMFMAAGGLLSMVILLFQGWRLAGFWPLFFVGLGESLMMWAGALPCILLVIVLNKSYIISVIITFFYTLVNYLLSTNDSLLTQPFGLNPGTLLPGPLSLRWIFQFYNVGNSNAEMAALLEKISPYFLNVTQAFSITAIEAVVFLTLIAVVYKRQKA
ncbi:ABC transporter permease [Eisenbergiella porci]|uniref:ABC transporter permease n=1 Tax=Eisenbergiella porci TaxID=2652274 RepID=UPI002F411EA2